MRLFKRGGNHDVRFSGCGRALFGRQLRGDWLLVGDQEPPLGSHLVTPRRGYLHHGIYVGARKVVHYSGLTHGLRRGPVEEVPFAHFARGQRVCVRSDAPSDLDVRAGSLSNVVTPPVCAPARRRGSPPSGGRSAGAIAVLDARTLGIRCFPGVERAHKESRSFGPARMRLTGSSLLSASA